MGVGFYIIGYLENTYLAKTSALWGGSFLSARSRNHVNGQRPGAI